MSLSPQRMARLVRVRKVREGEARAVWGQAQAAADAQAAQAAVQNARLLADRAELLDQLSRGRLSGPLLECEASLLDAEALLLGRLERAAASAATRAALAREPWTHARQGLRGLELLEQRLHERRNEERLAQEARELDEISIQRHDAHRRAQD